jgi:hypothetical protein
MTRLRRGIPAFVALLGLAAFAAAPADAATSKKYHPKPKHSARSTPPNFPVYESKGVDRNPGGDNLYFSDTRRPHYLVGPGYFQRWWF